ncbi:MAG: PQQ-binding-like beta-propeller repeat protein [Planctomycetaceae bacterium]|nr:PQQ-binding-like beta-propeller repeat protein [Planctomycetaceae bacterium]
MAFSAGFFRTWIHCVVVLVASSSQLLSEEAWPQFRGPLGNGHAPQSNIPLTWSETENITWKIPVIGEGFSSPVISGNKIWLTTAVVAELTPEQEEAQLAELEADPEAPKLGGQMTLKAIAFDVQSGNILHEIDCFDIKRTSPKHATNSYASPTPVIEKGRIYCHFGEYGICCIDTDQGKIAWKSQEFKINHSNGPGASPVLWKDLVVVHFDGIDQQFIAAFRKGDGTVAWNTKRSGVMHENPETQKAYCTPVITNVNGKDLLISPAADWVYGYDPATGKELWKASYGMLGFSTVPKPVIGNGLVYVCTSFMKSRLLAIKYDGTGDVTESHIAWHSDRQIPKKPSLMLIGTELYFVNDIGIGISLDAMTGEQIWQERFQGKYSASSLFASGHIYFFNEEGSTTVVKPGNELNIVAENKLDAGCKASPAVQGDALFLRTTTHLYRIEK